MDSVLSAFNFATLNQTLLIVGLVLLAGLVWRWRGQSSTRIGLQALSVFTLFVTFDLVLFGAFTRLTDSGLGCPDWPGCYGHATPIGAGAPIALAQAAIPTGAVTATKAWIEMLHRYLATGVGILILVLTVEHVRQRRQLRANAPSAWWSVAALLWVCVQGAFGALTVTMKLYPAIVTLHLLGGFTLLGILTFLATRLTQAHRGLRLERVTPRWRRRIFWGIGMVALQVALGGWVSSNYAVLACTDFPLCQGSWWPDMDFAQGFKLWRPLGMSGDGVHFLTFQSLTAIHVAHRGFAFAVFVMMAGLTLQLWSVLALRRQAVSLGLLTLAQLLTGLSNVTLGWPLLGALLHTGGAAAMVMVLVWVISATRIDMPKARP